MLPFKSAVTLNELNEYELEERLYAMVHHVDETEGNLASNHSYGLNIAENAPTSTLLQYWRNSESTTPYQKVNVQKDPATPSNNIKPGDVNQTNQTPKPKEEKRDSTHKPPAVDLSMFQSPVPDNLKITIEIIEQDDERAVVLDSSDEDEVIDVALPPKPTFITTTESHSVITIESSDEDELNIINPIFPAKTQVNVDKTTTSGGRDVSASPAPSAVSSVSDEFIRGDCIAMDTSSRHPYNPSFDFNLHGLDLLGQSTSSKTKKRKRSKETVTHNDECFVTPKSNAKNKRQKTKLYATEKSIPNPDVYDSDSNQSMDTNKNRNSYIVTEKSVPSTVVYESDSIWFECAKVILGQIQSDGVKSSGISKSVHKPSEQPSKTSEKNESIVSNNTTISIDLTGNESFLNLDESDIQETIISGNVSGFTEYEDYGDANLSKDISPFEPRCPRKICVNCGSPNQMYTHMCRNCCNRGALQYAVDQSSITIESSDEDELNIFNPISPAKTQVNVDKTSTSTGRDFSASPAPSAVSSLSDEFIRGDCIAINISSRHPDNPSIDFSFHGSDLLGQSTPSKTKKRNRTKETVTHNDECFATPKSDDQNKRLYATEKNIPNPDVYDSDSNQSMDTNKNRKSYIFTEKSVPSTDVYESDSIWFECVKEILGQIQSDGVKSSDISKSVHKPSEQPSKTSEKNESIVSNNTTISIDLTGNESFLNLDESDIQESIISGNVSGFTEYEDYGDANLSKDISPFEPRCPRKICVNCGSPNQMYTHNMCRNCCNWGALQYAVDQSSITIESSDEDELHIFNPISPAKTQVIVDKTSTSGGRDFSVSPAPSAVSSVSDEFIQ